MIVKINILLRLSVFVAFILAINFSGCSNSNEDKNQPEQTNQNEINSTHSNDNQSDTLSPAADGDQLESFDNWETYTYTNIRIIYPSRHPMKKQLYDFSIKTKVVIRNVGQFLNVPVPDDTLNIIFFTGFGHAEKHGFRKQTLRNDTLFYWNPGYIGRSAVELLIPNWQPDEPRHDFLKHGLLKLLDGSNRNFHEQTFRYIDSGAFVPLNELAVYPDYDSYYEYHHSGLAASFVDFMVYYYGIETFNLFYQSKRDFKVEVEGLLQISVDSLEHLWLNTVKEASGR